MFSPQISKLSRLAPNESASFDFSINSFEKSKQQLSLLRIDLHKINNQFEYFRQQTLTLMNEWMGKISTLVYRQCKQKNYMENELQKSKHTQNVMRCQVIQLKEMINEAMIDYSKDLQTRDQQIRKLTEQLKISHLSSRNPEQKSREQIKIEQSMHTDKESQLDIIQQESEQNTYSSATTLRQLREQKINQKSIQYRQQEKIDSSRIQKDKENCQPKEHKRTKSFIDKFRKTIEQSCSSKLEDRERLNNCQQSKIYKEPLKETSLNQKVESQRQYYSQGLKISVKESTGIKTQYLCIQPNQISQSSSTSDLILSDTDKINIPKTFETPTNLMQFKKKDTPVHRIMTEASPQRHKMFDENNHYFTNKPSSSQKRIFIDKKPSSVERSSSNEDKKSMKSSVSKQKIKVTAKMIEDMVHYSKKSNNKALVYLGGKSVFRKFLSELKTSFKKYVITLGNSEDEIKYQGTKRNGLRWGKGRLYYKNGAVYQGEFKQNLRHGRGSIFLSGISIYQGLWAMDKLHGQGYIKSMRFMANSCPSVFYEASYCGNLSENKLHGIGTIFLNPKQKIVTKFSNGCPIGELTYYNLHDIQFGVWPSE